MKNFTYDQPKNLKEAAKLFKTHPGALPYAGGTDALGLIKDDVIEPDHVVNLKHIPGMDKITESAGKGLKIGALVTVAQVAAHPLINKKYTALAQAARAVASPQLRNQGTIGGNICQRPRCWYYRGDFDCIRKGGDTCFAVDGENKFHCVTGGGPCFIVHPSDTAVALMALGASVNTVLGKKKRIIKLDDFFLLPEKDEKQENVLQPGEIVTEILVPAPATGSSSRFIKFAEREVWDFATVSGALVIEGNKQKIKAGRLVLGGVAPIPWLEKAVTKSLAGAVPDQSGIGKLAEMALKDAEPMSQNNYKIPMARNLIKQLLKEI